MNKGNINFEPLCETFENGEKLFTEFEEKEIGLLIGKRILEAFNNQPISEIAFLLKTNSALIKSFTEHGKLPPTEILLGIHKLTGVSIDWLLTGKTIKIAKAIRFRRMPAQMRLAA
jgi:hypothetical protein